MLEAQEGNLELARQMLKCAVKADPSSQQSWQVRHRSSPDTKLVAAAVYRPWKWPQIIAWSFNSVDRVFLS